MVDERISRAIDNDHTAAMKITSDGRKINRKRNGTLFAGPTGLFLCSICKKVFKTHHLYRKHLKNHAEKAFICQICGKGFVYRHYLHSHMITHNASESTQFPCHICPKRFALKGNLNQHLKFHANKKPFKCETCDKEFFQQEHLRTHLRHHNNERPFQCEVCSKSFNIKSSLQRHMNCHTGAKPFICDTCQRGYTRRSVLMLHIQQVHENRKPYQCSECHTCFSQKGNLQAHFRRKHLQPKLDGKRDHRQREKVRRTIRKQTFKQNPKTSKLSPVKLVPITDIFAHGQINRPSNMDFISLNGETLKLERDSRVYENPKLAHPSAEDQAVKNETEAFVNCTSPVNDEEPTQILNKLNIASIENGDLYRFLTNNNELFTNLNGGSQDTTNSMQNEPPPAFLDDLKGCDFDLSSDFKDWEEFFFSDSDLLADYDVDILNSPSKIIPSPVKIEPVEDQFSRHPISLCHDYASPFPINDSPESSVNLNPSNCSRTSPMRKNIHPIQVKKKHKSSLDAVEKHTSDKKVLEFSLFMDRKIPCMT